MDEFSAMTVVAPSSELSQVNISGTTLAIPASFFAQNRAAQGFWGYTATVHKKVKKADQAAYALKFHDGFSDFYLEQHPKCTKAEIAAGVHERYLKHPDVKVLALGKAS